MPKPQGQGIYLYHNSTKIGLNPNHPDYEKHKNDPVMLGKITKKVGARSRTNPSESSLNVSQSTSHDNTTPISLVVSRAEEDKDQVQQRNTRAIKEWQQGLQMSLGVASLVVALVFCYLARFPWSLAEELSMTPEEVNDIAEPASRLLAKTKIPAQVRTGLANSGDGIALSTALFAYVFRLFTILNPQGANNDTTQQAKTVPTGNQDARSTGPVASTNGIYTGSLANFGNYAAN